MQPKKDAMIKLAEDAFRLLSMLHDAVPDSREYLSLKGAAFAAMNDAATLARALRSSGLDNDLSVTQPAAQGGTPVKGTT